MSRNLCDTDCDQCDGVVVKTSPNRKATTADVGDYFKDYHGMLVADAECSECGAKYLAWVDIRGSEHHRKYAGHYAYDRYDHDGFNDLSYRAAFNDEPDDADLPTRYPWRHFARAMALAWFYLAKAKGPPHAEYESDCDPECGIYGSDCGHVYRVTRDDRAAWWAWFDGARKWAEDER